MFGGLKKKLWPLLASKAGVTHQQRMENYYCPQAESYDESRASFLHGRRDIWRNIKVPSGGVWLDAGCGTGFNLECIGPEIHDLSRVYAVDLSPSMLHVARQRVAGLGLNNVEVIEADVTSFEPGEPLDLVTLSYSLTMIPDWFATIDHARRMLKVGGAIAVVDFYVSRKFAQPYCQHSWWLRTMGPVLGGLNNVFLNADHLAYLRHTFVPVHLSEHVGSISKIPFCNVPYYQFIGIKDSPGRR